MYCTCVTHNYATKYCIIYTINITNCTFCTWYHGEPITLSIVITLRLNNIRLIGYELLSPRVVRVRFSKTKSKRNGLIIIHRAYRLTRAHSWLFTYCYSARRRRLEDVVIPIRTVIIIVKRKISRMCVRFSRTRLKRKQLQNLCARYITDYYVKLCTAGNGMFNGGTSCVYTCSALRHYNKISIITLKEDMFSWKLAGRAVRNVVRYQSCYRTYPCVHFTARTAIITIPSQYCII